MLMLMQQLSLVEMISLVCIFLFSFILPLYLLLTKKSSKRVPPGSFGLPIIGQSLSLLRAMRQNTAEAWLMERSRKYGPVSKMYIFGAPTVFLHGQAASKLIYTSSVLSSQKTSSSRRVFGKRNIFELSGDEHKRVRGALVSFLKPDVLKQSVGKMDEEIRSQIRMQWHGKQKISVMPFMKTLSFNIMSSFIVGIEQGSRRERLKQLFYRIVEGAFTVPINFPFTSFSRSIKARAKIRAITLELIHEKRAALEQLQASPQKDLLTCLIALRNEDNSPMLSDEEIVDNAIITMVAGHDTTSVMLTFLIKLLASDASIHASIVQEQEEIAKSKAPGELLTWDDLLRMKYTWGVAMETLRMYPPSFFIFRKSVKDFEYEGFHIPKGWQVMGATFTAHMNDSIFPNASEFDQARFEKQVSIPPYSFIAFGGGYRICPGNEFAKIETLVTIHNLVTQFTWKVSSPEMAFSRDPMPSFKNGLEILIEPKISTKFK
ncbi:taxadiene 5-alpha hydroxylase-like isoform X1 [Euphorbia lathyris]|uniref:taxadiene 5-alpha hydroxylase-like isoform X1 n=2 Tax=Euphorbia lathyris TaxID=212925 RepID=UPI0033131268